MALQVRKSQPENHAKNIDHLKQHAGGEHRAQVRELCHVRSLSNMISSDARHDLDLDQDFSRLKLNKSCHGRIASAGSRRGATSEAVDWKRRTSGLLGTDSACTQ